MIVGIDPGLSGAIACLHSDGLLTIFDMPVLEIRKGAKKKKMVAYYQVSNIMDDFRNVDCVLIEDNHARGGQNIQAMFNFGISTGIVIATAASHKFPIELVPPQTWKKDLKVPSDKDAARYRASQLLPKYTNLWARVKDDGRAEAALLAYYGMKHLKPGNDITFINRPTIDITISNKPRHRHSL